MLHNHNKQCLIFSNNEKTSYQYCISFNNYMNQLFLAKTGSNCSHILQKITIFNLH